jgi:hypothetical protein
VLRDFNGHLDVESDEVVACLVGSFETRLLGRDLEGMGLLWPSRRAKLGVSDR